MKTKILLSFGIHLSIALSTSLLGQESTYFRSNPTEGKSDKQVSTNGPTQFSPHEYLAKSNRLLLQKEISDACLEYHVHYTCTPFNFYENLKNSKPEGIFYTFDDKHYKISTQYKKLVNDVEWKVFSTMFFSENQIITIQLSTCMEHIKNNMILFNKLMEEYAGFSTDCPNKDKGNRQFK